MADMISRERAAKMGLMAHSDTEAYPEAGYLGASRAADRVYWEATVVRDSDSASATVPTTKPCMQFPCQSRLQVLEKLQLVLHAHPKGYELRAEAVDESL